MADDREQEASQVKIGARLAEAPRRCVCVLRAAHGRYVGDEREDPATRVWELAYITARQQAASCPTCRAGWDEEKEARARQVVQKVQARATEEPRGFGRLARDVTHPARVHTPALVPLTRDGSGTGSGVRCWGTPPPAPWWPGGAGAGRRIWWGGAITGVGSLVRGWVRKTSLIEPGQLSHMCTVYAKQPAVFLSYINKPATIRTKYRTGAVARKSSGFFRLMSRSRGLCSRVWGWN